MKIPSGWHRYMEGYDVQKVEIAPGRFQVEYVFTGNYRSFALTESQFKYMKLQYAIAAICLAVVYFWAATMTTSSHRVNSVAVPAFMAVVPVVCLIYGVVGYAMTPQRMTPRNYRSSVLMTRYSALVIAVMMVVSAIMHVVYIIGVGQKLIGCDMQYFLLCLLNASLAIGIFIATIRIRIKVLYRDNQRINRRFEDSCKT